MRKITLDKLDMFFAAVSEDCHLYIPIDTNGGAKYERWHQGQKLSDAQNTTRSAKDFFFPQTENLMDLKLHGKKVEIIDIREECEDFVIFGARACDVRSFTVLDKVFLSDPVDSYYKNRRDHGLIVSMACTKPHETCFCEAFGIDPAEPEGDIVCYKTDKDLFFDVKTAKGSAFLSKYDKITEECDDTQVEKQKDTIRERMKKLPLHEFTPSAFGAGNTARYFDAPEWKELSSSCLGCGTCTFVCPTCQCYDIKDFNTGHCIKRFRCWDSCMYSEFTQMSAGQPRLTQLERFRQRFMHKLVYYPENNNGLFSCVGCGRCISKCPVGMNIVKVMKKIGGKEND